MHLPYIKYELIYDGERRGEDTIDERRKENAKREDDKERSYRVSNMIYVIFKLYHPRNDALLFVGNALVGTHFSTVLRHRAWIETDFYLFNNLLSNAIIHPFVGNSPNTQNFLCFRRNSAFKSD